MPKPLWSLVEKVLATYLQAFAATLVLGGLFDASAVEAAAIAAIPAALTLIANRLPVAIPALPYWVALAYRVGATAAVGFIGYLVAQPIFSVDRSALVAAGGAAGMAALAALKGLLASKVGDPSSPALLPVPTEVEVKNTYYSDGAV